MEEMVITGLFKKKTYIFFSLEFFCTVFILHATAYKGWHGFYCLVWIVIVVCNKKYFQERFGSTLNKYLFPSVSQDLATPETFSRNPSRVWEFYQYRRDVALNKKPNAAHLAIAECEARLRKQGRSVVVITQCIDDLHQQAGSKHVLRVHGEKQTVYSFNPIK